MSTCLLDFINNNQKKKKTNFSINKIDMNYEKKIKKINIFNIKFRTNK